MSLREAVPPCPPLTLVSVIPLKELGVFPAPSRALQQLWGREEERGRARFAARLEIPPYLHHRAAGAPRGALCSSNSPCPVLWHTESSEPSQRAFGYR